MKKWLTMSFTFPLFASEGYASDSGLFEPEPEAVQYVRACDAYGAGYFYIPGSETCMRISGYVRTTAGGGDNVYVTRKSEIKLNTYTWQTRATLDFQTATETELGTLKSFVELRSDWSNGEDTSTGALRYGYIELGGLHLGVDDSIFSRWTGYFGAMNNDDITNPTAYERTNAISYTFANDSGFSTIIGFEQGNSGVTYDGSYGGAFRFRNDPADAVRFHKISGQIDGYTPNVVVGVKYEQGWGSIAAVGAYDAFYKEWAGKVRINANLTDKLSLWGMGGYKTGNDYYALDTDYNNGSAIDTKGRTRITHVVSTFYGDWGGEWALWGGGTFAFTKSTSLNFQLNYDEAKTFAVGINLNSEIIPGLILNPELSYVSWDDDYGWKEKGGGYLTSLKGEDAFQALLMVQRNF